MKRAIAIWVGIIAVILIIGFIVGAAGKGKEKETPIVSTKEVIVGYDENGNSITQDVPQDEKSIEIDGQDFVYNTGAFKDKPFKIEGKEIPMNFNIKDLTESGLTQDTTTRFTIGDSTITANYNSSTGKGITLNAYTNSYVNITKFNVPVCKNFELPSGIVLGKSTLEDVQRVYGTSVVYPASNNFCTTSKYFMDETKTTGFMVLYFDDDNILCGVDIGCNIMAKTEDTTN